LGTLPREREIEAVLVYWHLGVFLNKKVKGKGHNSLHPVIHQSPTVSDFVDER
jgi:hypothetical protein